MSDKQLLDNIRKEIREEVEAETKKTESDNFFSNARIGKSLSDLKNSIKDLKISNSRLEKGQQKIEAELQIQGKVLKSVQTKVNKISKDVKVVIDQTDRRITNLDKRTDRIENHLNLPPQQ